MALAWSVSSHKSDKSASPPTTSVVISTKGATSGFNPVPPVLAAATLVPCWAVSKVLPATKASAR